MGSGSTSGAVAIAVLTGVGAGGRAVGVDVAFVDAVVVDWEVVGSGAVLVDAFVAVGGGDDVVGIGAVFVEVVVVGTDVVVDEVEVVAAAVVGFVVDVAAIFTGAAFVDVVLETDPAVAGASFGLPSTVIVTPIARPSTAPHAITPST